MEEPFDAITRWALSSLEYFIFVYFPLALIPWIICLNRDLTTRIIGFFLSKREDPHEHK